MKLGFTGSQAGMNMGQRNMFVALIGYLRESYSLDTFHHGDCIGSDNDAHLLAMMCMIPIIIHPPTNSSKRANCRGAVKIEVAYPYLDRNKHIVDATHMLIATPNTETEILRSGTWSTIRYAEKQQKPIYIIDITGRITLKIP